MGADYLAKKQDYDADRPYFELHLAWYRAGLWRRRVDGVFAEVRPHLRPGSRALDVGCATGTFAIELARVPGVAVTALDFSTTALGVARENAEAEAVAEQIRFVAAAAERTGLREGAIDVVVAADVIEHLHDPAAFLAEMRRVLRPGGVLVLETCNTLFRRFALYPRLRRLADRLGLPDSRIRCVDPSGTDYGERYHIALRSYPELLVLVRDAGLEVVRHRPFGWWLEMRGLDRLTHLACRLLRPVYGRAAYFEDTDVIIVARRPAQAVV